MKRIALIFMALLYGSAITLFAQKPTWLGNTPKEGNSTYKFVEITSYGNNIEQARSEAQRKLANNEQLVRSVAVSTNRTDNKRINQVYNNGKLSEVVENVVDLKTTYKGRSFVLQAGIVDEYATNNNGRCQLHTLYMVAVEQNPVFDKVYLKTKYGARGLWRSAIVPGWGQFHKGSIVKGSIFLGGTALLGGGIIYCQSRVSNSRSFAAKTHNVDHKRIYQRRITNFGMARNICIGGAAALYVWNLIDAIVAPGARRVVVKPTDFSEYIMNNNYIKNDAIGMSATFTF